MAFNYTIDEVRFSGNKKLSRGTFTSSGGGTGGNVFTGLRICETFDLIPKKSSVLTNQCTYNTTLPVAKIAGEASAKVAIVTDADVVGSWEASGR